MSQQSSDLPTSNQPGTPGPQGVGPGPYSVANIFDRIVLWFRKITGGSERGK